MGREVQLDQSRPSQKTVSSHVGTVCFASSNYSNRGAASGWTATIG